jgi:putative NADH-flavin reductase
MQVTVFGANGRVGQQIVRIALQKGYKVKAAVHSSSNLSKDPNLEIVIADIYKLADVEKAIAGSDVVFSALSSWGTPGKDILSSGIKNIIKAMDQQNIKRLISLTGSDARATGDDLSMVHRLSHLAISFIAKKIIIDSEEHLKLLEVSDLNWSVVRSSVMNNRSKIDDFKLTSNRPTPWSTINRGSVAKAMVNLANGDDYSKSAPYIDRAS